MSQEFWAYSTVAIATETCLSGVVEQATVWHCHPGAVTLSWLMTKHLEAFLFESLFFCSNNCKHVVWGHTCSVHYTALPTAFQLWATNLHSYETVPVRPPLCFTQMLSGRVIPARVPPPASSLSRGPWPIFINAPPLSCQHTSKSLSLFILDPALAAAFVCLICSLCIIDLALSYFGEECCHIPRRINAWG